MTDEQMKQMHMELLKELVKNMSQFHLDRGIDKKPAIQTGSPELESQEDELDQEGMDSEESKPEGIKPDSSIFAKNKKDKK